MARLPAVLGTDDLPLAELCAARIDGELFTIDEGWAPIDEPDLPSLRAAVIALRVSRPLIIERLSAAWVHDGLDSPPRTAQFCVPHGSRIAVIADRRVTIREVALTDDEFIELGGVRCTTPARTAFDLLREAALPDVDSERIVTRLLAARPRLEGQIRERFDLARRMPYRARALARLDHAVEAASANSAGSGQPSLTR
ncbi:hypothetical protein [Agromyces neolithicus]